MEQLTKRELQIVKLISTGLSNKEIAQELFISQATVKFHLNHIYQKLELCKLTDRSSIRVKIVLWYLFNKE